MFHVVDVAGCKKGTEAGAPPQSLRWTGLGLRPVKFVPALLNAPTNPG
jgi:hypothetical protein